MKKVMVYSSLVLLCSCDPDVAPKHDVNIFGSYIKETGSDFHLFSKRQKCDGNPHYIITDQDTLTVDGKLYDQVFFVKIIPKELDKDFKDLGMTPCSLRDIYSRADTVRKQVPGFGDRKFLVVENVVGIR